MEVGLRLALRVRARALLFAAFAAVTVCAAIATAPAHAAAPVPCSYAGAGHYDCSFWPAGNGISAGAPVRAATGARVGWLNHGTNWVVCQLRGGRIGTSSVYNHWWAWTEANDGRWGWVNAYYAQGGTNDGAFAGVPSCGRIHGSPPGGAPTRPPGPRPVPCTAASGGRWDCTFYVQGDGIGGGSPVQSSDGGRVGYLNYGSNWIICQAAGAEVTNGADHNKWWAFTNANDGRWGWVNAVYASGGANDGPFGGGVPACGGAHGSPPRASGSGGPGSGGGSGSSGPAPVPCEPGSGRKVICSFYPPGDGWSGGSPVQSTHLKVVGYLNVGSNFVICQQRGGEVTSGAYHNRWWAWTVANDGKWGWVNALYASGGANDGAFARVPQCAGAHGSPPQASSTPPHQQPSPPPPPIQNPGSLSAVRRKIVSTALAQNGYNPDRDGCARYSSLVCGADRGEWCSIFATWVWEQADVLPGDLIPIYPYSGSPYLWAQSHTYVLPPRATPKPGDLVFFGSGPQWPSGGGPTPSEHVAVILQVLPSGALFVMNGNGGTGDGWAQESTFFPGNPTAGGEPGPVYGYASPVRDRGASADLGGAFGGFTARIASGDSEPSFALAQRAIHGQDPRAARQRARRIAARHPALEHMPYVGRHVAIEIADLQRSGRLVIAVLYHGTQAAAVREFRSFLRRWHDTGREYRVRYSHVNTLPARTG